MKQKTVGLLLALTLALSLVLPAQAASAAQIDQALTDTASVVYHQVTSPQVGSIGGEWAVLGLARSGANIPAAWYQSYRTAVTAAVQEKKGILHEKKYTEYARVVLALTAVGIDPADVGGYNLLTPLGDYDKTLWQGLNGPIWALIALDSGSYSMPENKTAATQATRQSYVDAILSAQESDGGWSLTAGGTEDADLTAMALQALAPYRTRAAVKQAVENGLAWLSARQQEDGGFASAGTENAESAAQVVVALCQLGLPQTDSRFVKNGVTPADNLLTFWQAGAGFRHTAGGSGSSQMATEQGLYALAALSRFQSGKNSLYAMSDAEKLTGTDPGTGTGLAGKQADVKPVPVTHAGITFPDIASDPARQEIETLAARGILTGMNETTFAPAATMTRAQFAALVVRALGLTPQTTGTFSDVKPADWFAPYVGTADTCGIVKGTAPTAFTPNGTITRQEAAVMTARAAGLCGISTAYSEEGARSVLAQFSDYPQCAAWAQSALALCYDQGILDSSALNIRPAQTVTRSEVARMLCRLLDKANLL